MVTASTGSSAAHGSRGIELRRGGAFVDGLRHEVFNGNAAEGLIDFFVDVGIVAGVMKRGIDVGGSYG